MLALLTWQAFHVLVQQYHLASFRNHGLQFGPDNTLFRSHVHIYDI